MVTAAYTLASFISDIGTVFTAAIGWVGDVGDAIIASPVLLIGVALPIIGVGVGLFKRLLNV